MRSSSLIHFGTKLLSGFSLARKYFATAKCSTSPSASLAPRSCRTIFTFIQVLCRPALLVSPRETGAKPCATLFLTPRWRSRSEEHTSELQSQSNLVCRLLLEKKKNTYIRRNSL